MVRLLGPFEIAMGAAPAARWSSFKGLTVLKFLLMHDGRARREELMELLWRGYRPQSARNNLNVAIYALRRAADAPGLLRGAVPPRPGPRLVDRPRRVLLRDRRRGRRGGPR